MVAGINGVLRGIQGDLKSAILSLSEEGWTPSKTNGGHIRLDHPAAARPVFTSSTPGDYRTPANLRRDCRGALRAPLPCETDPISEEEAMRSLKKHKAARKTKRRSPNRLDTVTKRVVEQFTAEARLPKAEPATERKPDCAQPTAPAQTLPKNASSKTEKRDMNMMAEIAPEKVTPVKAEKAPTRPAPVKPEAAPARPSAPADAPIASDAVALGIRIGMRIAKGELRQIQITPDMVGKTLIMEQGEIYWVNGAPETDAPVAKKGGYRKNARFNDAILAFLEELKGEEVPVSMIAEHMVEKGFYKPRSARQGVLRRLDQLHEEGRVRYLTGQGEPCASLPPSGQA